ncbi:MAG: DUF1289 domain-containing protein [Filomicrobium sp.]
MSTSTSTTSTRRPISPCINVCELDDKAGMCVGCGRTTAEIGNWLKFTQEERDAVWDQLPMRLEKLKK